MAKYLTDLANVLRAANLEVIEMPGWKTRGRPGDFNPRGILCHHTAGPGDGYNDAWYMAATGRPDLSAPLAQLALSRKGVWYVLAAGRANHAGKCKGIGGLTAGDGNEQLIGVEAQNRGTSAEDWSPTQYGAYVRGVAALKKHYGWSIVFGHKETSTSGKVDPDFNMDKFRADVAATTTPATLSPEEDPLAAITLEQIADVVRNHVMSAFVLIPKRETPVARQAHDALKGIVREEVAAQVAPLTVAVTTLAESNDLDPDAVLALVRDRLAQIRVSVDDDKEPTA